VLAGCDGHLQANTSIGVIQAPHSGCAPGDVDSDMRMLVCFHANRHILMLLNLMEALRGMWHRRLTMYAMHLVELSEWSSAITLVQRVA
jgi:hypothetical protein